MSNTQILVKGNEANISSRKFTFPKKARVKSMLVYVGLHKYVACQPSHACITRSNAATPIYFLLSQLFPCEVSTQSDGVKSDVNFFRVLQENFVLFTGYFFSYVEVPRIARP
jgi:hypothetical protein